IQALERSQPVLPMGLGYLEGVTHDYYRHGTTTLFAALNVLQAPCRTGGIRGRPHWHFLRQKSWKPFRCQPMKVLGVTTVSALRQLNQRLSHRRVKRAGWEVRRGLILRSL